MPRRPKVALIDTNVILRFLVGDVPSQAERATALMERLEAGTEQGEILETVIAEAVWTLESFYRAPRVEIATRLATILRFAGVRVTHKTRILHALGRFGATSADFVDCLLAATAPQRRMMVYSFDRDLQRLGADSTPPV